MPSRYNCLVRNIISIVNKPLTLGGWAYLLEIVLMDYEMNLILNDSFLKLENSPDQLRIRDRYIVQAIGWLNMQPFIVKQLSSGMVWMTLISLLLLSILFLASFFFNLMQRSSKKDYSMTWRIIFSSAVRKVLYLYGYGFYFLIIFTSTFVQCVPINFDQPVIALAAELPILSTLAKSLTNETEKRFTLNWTFDLSKECFGGEHIVASALTITVISIAIVIKYINVRLLNFYPNPKITDVKRNNLDLVHLLAFFTLYALQQCILMLRLTAWIPTYYWIALSLYGLIIITNIFLRPFYNYSLQKFKIYKYCFIFLFTLWIILIRSSQELRNSLFYKQINMIIAIGLFFPLVFRLLKSYLSSNPISDYNNSGLNTGKTPKENYIVYDLIYDFEWVKLNSENIQGTSNSKSSSLTQRMLLKFLRAAKDHNLHCEKEDCHCHSFEVYRRASRYDKLEEWFNANWLAPVLFIMHKILNSRLESSLMKKSDPDKMFKKSFRIWALFTLNNFGNTKTLLSMLGKFKSGEIMSKNREDRVSSESKVKWDNLDIKVLEQIVAMNMSEFENSNQIHSWNVEVDAGNEEEPDKIESDHLNLYPIIEFSNSILIISKKMNQVSTTKLEIIERLNGEKSYGEIVEKSNVFRKGITYIDGVLDILRIKSNYVICEVAFIEIHYLRNIKEDLYSMKMRLNDIKSKTITKDLSFLFKIDFKKTVRSLVLNVSGEPTTIHKIRQVCGDPENLGYSIENMMNMDLSYILPYAFIDLHRELMNPSKQTSHYLERKLPLEMSARAANGIIQPAEISYRIDSSIDNGLGYVGLIQFSSEQDGQINLILDENGVIKDLCKVGNLIFKREIKISNYLVDLGTLLEKYSTAIMIFEFEVKDPYYESVNAKRELFFAYECSHELFDDWIPLGLTIQGLSSEESSYLINMRVVRNYSLRKIIYNVQLKAQLNSELRPTDEVQMFQTLFGSRRKLENHSRGGTLSRASPTSRSFQKMVSGASDLIQSRRNTRFANLVREEAMSKIDFSSKYAHQTDEFQINTQRQNGQNISKLSLTNNMDDSPERASLIDHNRIQLIDNNRMNEERAILNSAARLTISVANGIAQLEQPEKRLKDQFEMAGHLLKKKITDIMLDSDEQEATLLKHSRFIHHMINFKKLRTSTMIFSIPVILMLIGFVCQFLLETREISKFARISNDLVIIDSYEYLSWICYLQTSYMTIRRMIMEGYATDDQFATWGISSMNQRMIKIMQLPDLQGQFIKNTNRLRKGMFNSSYRELYDLHYVENTEIDIKTYIEGEGIVMKRMKAVDALRYTQNFIDQLLSDPNKMFGIWGPNYDESQSPYEAVVRYNNFNPLWKYVSTSIIFLNSF